ncbi:hypothetical protein Vafri_15256 [Volvox africanus]|uniref:Uncharacterized protein n=1 Tax=Volvox africanus TaxID=51714 RepID=A0A8J4BFT9_9CHLO|nr:hypothetical protein Vafri_15256 [Volvox africanus]
MGPREAYLRGALGNERFEATAAALSQPPRITCMRVNTLRTSTQEVVTRARQLLGSGWDQGVVRVHPQVPCAVILQGSGPHEVSYSAAGALEYVGVLDGASPAESARSLSRQREPGEVNVT